MWLLFGVCGFGCVFVEEVGELIGVRLRFLIVWLMNFVIML